MAKNIRQLTERQQIKMDIKQIREIKDKIKKFDEDRFYAMFSPKERTLISEYIKLSTHNDENEFFAEIFNISNSCNVILDTFNNHFAPKLEISRSNPFRELSREELIESKNLIMNHVKTYKKGMERNRILEEYLKKALKDKKELWEKVISIFDENNRYSNEGDLVEFIINGNKEIVMCAHSPYIHINLFPDRDDVEIYVTCLTRITENQTNEIILEDKLAELEEIEKWVDEKIESSIKYIKNYGLDEKYLARK